MKRLGLLLVVLAVSFVLLSWGALRDRWLIERGIRHACRLIEEKRLEDAFWYISSLYKDKYGNDRESLEAKIENFLSEFGEFKVRILRKKKILKGETCNLYLVVLIEAAHREFGYLRGSESLRASLHKEKDGVWRVVQAEVVVTGGEDERGHFLLFPYRENKDCFSNIGQGPGV